MNYKAVEVIWIFLVDTPTDRHTDRGVPDLRNNVPWCLTCKYTNTNTQVPKFINTALIKVSDRHDMCYIFESNKAEAHKFQNVNR